MPTPVLQRLYRTKLALIAVIFTASGIALLASTQWRGWERIGDLPVADIGAALLTTGLLALVFEYFDTQDADERLGAAIDAKAHVLRDAVIDGFATRPQQMAAVVSPTVIDAVMRNCIAMQLDNPALADDIHNALKWQIAEASKSPQYEAHVSVNLSPSEHGPPAGRGAVFAVTTRWRYRTPDLPRLLRFSAVADPDVYRQLIHDPATIETWQLYPPPKGREINAEEFELLTCVINGKPQDIRRQDSGSDRLFTVIRDDTPNSGDYIDVSYSHRTLVPQHGHRLFLDFGITNGLRLDFSYGPECGIEHVEAAPYVSGPIQPRIEHSPNGLPLSTVSVDFGEAWTYPRSGVAFTWILNRELV